MCNLPNGGVVGWEVRLLRSCCMPWNVSLQTITHNKVVSCWWCGSAFLRNAPCRYLTQNKCSFNLKQTSSSGFFFACFYITWFDIFVEINLLSNFYLQNSRRHFHSLTKMVMGPSRPRSWGLSCALWVRIPQKQSCRIWSMRWMLMVRTPLASCTHQLYIVVLSNSFLHWHLCYQEMGR